MYYPPLGFAEQCEDVRELRDQPKFSSKMKPHAELRISD
jgi:hypothetical protein